MGFREVCIGQKGASLLEPMNYSVYENFSSKIYIAFSEVARESMPKAAYENRQQGSWWQ